MAINKWRSKCNPNSVVTMSRVVVERDGGMQVRNPVMCTIHEALADGTLHADEEMLKESF